MIRIENPDKVFFVSDTHFNHSNIIKYCDRPYKDKYEMDEALIYNWNEVVPEDGVVFHLGDFKWSGSWNTTLDRLNGKIHLIKGNHDYEAARFINRFESIQEQLTIEIGDSIVKLNHFPYLCFPSQYIQLFGHIHLSTRRNEGYDFERSNLLQPNQYDVGVDLNNYKPISWKKVYERVKYQIDNNINCLYWIDHE